MVRKYNEKKKATGMADAINNSTLLSNHPHRHDDEKKKIEFWKNFLVLPFCVVSIVLAEWRWTLNALEGD